MKAELDGPVTVSFRKSEAAGKKSIAKKNRQID
ncbi:hypothetical protein GGD87_002819 [Rhodobaca bogoriensis DSM 18756]|nr:hypothetical protein [Rhodobaca bogoriensis DSM 18756]